MQQSEISYHISEVEMYIKKQMMSLNRQLDECYQEEIINQDELTAEKIYNIAKSSIEKIKTNKISGLDIILNKRDESNKNYII